MYSHHKMPKGNTYRMHVQENFYLCYWKLWKPFIPDTPYILQCENKFVLCYQNSHTRLGSEQNHACVSHHELMFIQKWLDELQANKNAFIIDVTLESNTFEGSIRG